MWLSFGVCRESFYAAEVDGGGRRVVESGGEQA